MKRTLPFILLLGLAASCGGRTEQQGEEPLPPEDTLNVPPADTVAADTLPVAEETPPKAADTLFDDFIYAFMRSRNFQKSRIVFPLPCKVDGRDSLVARGQWTFDRLYSRLDTYTMVFADKASMEREKDTSIRHVVVEWVYLSRQKVKRYVFDKRDGLWMLSSLELAPLKENANSDFYAFYHSFATDSVYQRTHVAESLAFKTYDDDNFEDIDGVLDVDQWFIFRPELPQDEITNIIYGDATFASQERFLVLSSLSGGMNCTLHFSHKGGHWLLDRYEN